MKGGVLIWYIKQCIAYIKSKVFKRLTAYYIMLVKPSRKITQNNCVEIQFKNDIMFLIK